MSDDPETARQIAELSLDTRPLLVLDVDEVVLEFVRPFIGFLGSNGMDLSMETFRLHGNISRRHDGAIVEHDAVSALIDDFFLAQERWQTPLEGVVEALESLSVGAEIVMLTAMPHRHRERRRGHLDVLGLPYPLLTTEMAKGPAVRLLRGVTGRAVAFVDDIPRNLVSVRAAVADAHLFHLMAMRSMRRLLPPLPEGIGIVEDWTDAAPRIAAALGIPDGAARLAAGNGVT